MKIFIKMKTFTQSKFKINMDKVHLGLDQVRLD